MSTLNKIFITLIIIPIFFHVLPVAFNFFGIPSRVYMIYVIWFIALMVLNAILPSSVPNMFSPIKV